MKSIFIILTFVYFMPSSQAQQVPFKEILVGKYLEIDKPIKGIEYTFSDRIYKLYYDSLKQNITAQLRG